MGLYIYKFTSKNHFRAQRVAADSNSRGNIGWLYKTLVHNKRSVAIENKEQKLYIKPNKSSQIRAYVEKGVIAFLITCKDEWCHIATDNPKITGWIPQTALWGVLKEEFKE